MLLVLQNWGTKRIVKKPEKVPSYYERPKNESQSLVWLTFACHLYPSGNFYTMMSSLCLLHIVKISRYGMNQASEISLKQALPTYCEG